MVKNCEHCGKEFNTPDRKARKGYGRFCGLACFGAHNRKKVDCTCLTCGKVFFDKPSQVLMGNAKYCSRVCWYSRPSVAKTVRCAYCDKQYQAKPSELLRGARKYCSTNCRDLNLQKRREFTCAICGLETMGKRGVVESGRKKYCSKRCQHVGRARLVSGSNHPSWRGGDGIYPEEFNAEFKRRIRKRDMYSCALCGNDARCVHHIDYNKMHTVPENCITLCTSCHGKTNFRRDSWQKKLTKVIRKQLCLAF